MENKEPSKIGGQGKNVRDRLIKPFWEQSKKSARVPIINQGYTSMHSET